MIAAKIRTLRNTKGYSQEYTASKLNIKQNSYSKLESGQTRLTIDRINQLAELFEVEPEYFLQNEATFINNNNGENSKGIGNIYTETYNESSGLHSINDKYEVIIEEQRKQIVFLMEELENCRKERSQFLALLSSFKNL